MEEEKFVTSATIRKHFAVSDETLKRARETGLQYVQMGSRYRYKVSWFMEWMDADTKRYQDEVLPALRKQASVARAAKRAAAKKKREPAA